MSSNTDPSTPKVFAGPGATIEATEIRVVMRDRDGVEVLRGRRRSLCARIYVWQMSAPGHDDLWLRPRDAASLIVEMAAAYDLRAVLGDVVEEMLAVDGAGGPGRAQA